MRGPNNFTTFVMYFCPLDQVREGRQTVVLSNPTSHPAPERPSFFPQGPWATAAVQAGTSLGLPGRINGLVLELRSVLG